MEKLVTYGITSYNHINYIKKTIDSVLNQTYSNIELIVIDDCSTDGSDAFLERYAKEKGFIFIKNAENIGAPGTSSKILHLAKGEYVCLLASDDWIKPEKVKLQMKYLEENNWVIDALYGPVIAVNEKDNTERVIRLQEENTIMRPNEALLSLYETCEGLGLLQSGILRTDVARKIDFLKNYKSDDFLFYVRLLQKGYVVGYCATPLTYYRLHEANSHRDADYCLFELEIPVVRDFFPQKYHRKNFAKFWLTASIKWFHQKKIIKSFVYLSKSLWYDFKLESIYKYFCELVGMRFVNFKKKIGLENVTLLRIKKR